jgi:SAM-dependent methyltransferase
MHSLQRLRCPYCHGGLRYRDLAPGYGILDCRCDYWPVIDHIPILQKTPVGHFEHTTGKRWSASGGQRELLRLLLAGQYEKALTRCLVFPMATPHLSRLIGWKLSHSTLVRRLQYLRCTEEVTDLLRRRQSLTATELFHFFFNPNSPLGSGKRDYFVHRFGQPQHLAALALLELIPQADEPVLDIACGAGHVAHYLQKRSNPVPVTGCDMNFCQLWIAKHWVSPQSDFVCCDLRDGLPFADNSFSAVVCSDAYHYIENRRALLNEIARCAPGRPAVLTRVGNGEVGPNDGYEESIGDYLAQLPNAQVFHEYQLLRDYLARRAPQPCDASEAREHKWLSFAWNVPEAGPVSEEWPHAVGRHTLNSIYNVIEEGSRLRLQYQFPSSWYAFENSQMLTYLPRCLQMTRAELNEQTDALIRKTVVIGVPEKYRA